MSSPRKSGVNRSPGMKVMCETKLYSKTFDDNRYKEDEKVQDEGGSRWSGSWVALRRLTNRSPETPSIVDRSGVIGRYLLLVSVPF